MYKYILNHEKWILKQLKSSQYSSATLLDFHQQMIARMQHERLVHLLVTLFTALLFLASMALLLILTDILAVVLAIVTVTLAICYIVHYYRLENAVQRWYKIADDLSLLSLAKTPLDATGNSNNESL